MIRPVRITPCEPQVARQQDREPNPEDRLERDREQHELHRDEDRVPEHVVPEHDPIVLEARETRRSRPYL